MIGERSIVETAASIAGREEAFRDWFAGLIDAIGTFGIYQHTDRGFLSVRVNLVVQMKPVDEPALHAIKARYGGCVYRLGEHATWQLGSVPDAEMVVRALEGRLRRPSRVEQFVPWARAVEALAAGDKDTAIEAREELRKLREKPPR